MMGDGFKAHDARLGPKLGQAQASGLSGLARRVEAARGRVRAEELERRAVEAAGRVVAGMARPALSTAAGAFEAAAILAAGADQGEPTRTPDRSAGRPAPAGGDDSIGRCGAVGGSAASSPELLPKNSRNSGERERIGGGRGTKLDGAVVKASPAASTGKSGRKVGRPKFEGVRPWVAAGVSRAEWYRRRQAGDG
jgi:hypothetical protein